MEVTILPVCTFGDNDQFELTGQITEIRVWKIVGAWAKFGQIAFNYVR
jgi:hypothetical protein